jgi:hypothetical protein
VKTALFGALMLASIIVGMSCARHVPPQDGRRNEITALSIQIREWRREAGLPVDPRHEDVIQSAPISLKQAAAVCPVGHPVPATCSEVCSLADAICDNAEQICILAGELGDQWSRDKCNSAKASCRDAKQRCCACSTPVKASAAW